MSGQQSRKSSLKDEKLRNSPTMQNAPRKLSMFDENGVLIAHTAEDRPRRLSLLRPLRRNSEQVDGHGVETGPGLDEEMEKVFAIAEEDRFDVARFAASPDSNTSKRSFNEKDYSFHRKKSYPHTHVPIKSLYSRSTRNREVTSPRESESESIEGGASIEANESRKLSQTGTDSDTGWSSPPMPLHPTINEDNSTRSVHSGAATPEEEREEPVLSSESEPQVFERAVVCSESPVFGSPSDTSRRVQFQIGDTKPVTEGMVEDEQATADEEAERRDSVTEDPVSIEPDEKKKLKRKHVRHHHHRRKYSLQEDGGGGYKGRIRAGSDFSEESGRHISIQPEEMSMLQEQDIDDLTSHRFDDAKGFRRYRIQSKGSLSSVIHIGRKNRMDSLQTVVPLHTLKKMFDHSPHEVFVQLDELHGDGEDREWKETARWIKYEEDVEEGADRWGRPHVASLSFHSLLNLRRCLETGVVLLDLEEKDLPGVAYRVVEQMVVDELIEPEEKPTIMRALLLRHRHVNEHDRFRFGMKRTFSSYTSLQNLADDKGRPKIVPSIASMDTVSSLKSPPPVTNHTSHNEFDTKPENHTSIQVETKEELTYTSSTEDMKKATKESILKRIPLGAEATTVLVGAVDFLEQPTIAFIRLAEGVLMPSMTEVPIPVRFLFILLGPSTADLDYHEIGRSISTLMSNAQFHNVAYKAVERKELLSAINEFLDDSIVLPPGDWERKALLPFGELRAKSQMIRQRKNTRLMEDDEMKKALLLLEAEGEKPHHYDPLRRTGIPFGGLMNDVKRRLPHYKSDITEGFNLQCLAAAIFMYFAALSGAITFGGLMADKTNNLIGISETLIATSAAGIFFSLLAGQPLIIIGATGPLLLFDESLYSFCLSNGIDFLTIRVYIGLWLGIIGLVVVCFEGSVLVKLFTRFTEEIFAALISILYIVESIVKLFVVFHEHPLMAVYCSDSFIYNDTVTNSVGSPKNRSHMWNDSGIYSGSSLDSLSLFINDSYSDNSFSQNNATMKEIVSTYEAQTNLEVLQGQPNTALLCLILALGTFFIAYYLRQFRNSKFLGRSARRALGDFGVPIAIITMVTLDYLVPETYTEKLQVPEGLSPSSPTERGWIISPDVTHVWLVFAAAAPALLVYILLFMETHICELIINKKERRLKKGSGFHLDIVVVCIANVGCGLLGAPWQCAATVRSIAHVSAVTVMSRTHAPGDKPHIIEVKEQRLSALLVSLFVGLSVLMAPLLRLVPMSVLFGVFLYMGISSTNGIQFFERLKLFFMPVKHHPQAAYVRRVHSMKMHLFTLIQLLCLTVLWIVKSTEASLAFPFFLILMVPLRAQLQFLFTPEELRALDSEEADSDSLEDEPDFYTEAPLPG